jgi:hypothetical protein
VIGARDVVVNALTSGTSHAIYAALLILALFPSDSGDKELVKLIEIQRDSRNSRIRRTAVRAFVATLSINHREMVCQQILGRISRPINCTQLHFDLMLLKKLKKLGLSVILPSQLPLQNCHILDILVKKINNQPIDFINQTISELILTLKHWKMKNPVPEQLFTYLINELISPNPNRNQAFQIEGLHFLTKFLPSHILINFECLANLIQTIEIIEIRANLIRLLRFVEHPIIDQLLPLFVELAGTPFEGLASIHLALSSIADIIHKSEEGLKVIVFLLINDISQVRMETARLISDPPIGELVLIDQIIGKLSDHAKCEICEKWRHEIEIKSQVDEFGEPLTFFVDELFIIFHCFPSLETVVFAENDYPANLSEIRSRVIRLQFLGNLDN